jgi:hypothetical protein
MFELMLDLETLDTSPSAVVLSIGAVIWESIVYPDSGPQYHIADRFYRKLALQSQFDKKRTVSESTLLWWQQQDSVAQQEAFDPVRRPVLEVLTDLDAFTRGYDPAINHFWASPVSFDFGITEDLMKMYDWIPPWTYRQKYDVRTVVNEANYSAKDHQSNITGVAHTPVYDCEWQIDLLTAARRKIKKRIG